uniref:ATP synthase F0 subunit 6 n=1 Tax=Catamiarus brevipennis TaxID=1348906 RepID=UPI0022F2C74A|nr:ATP synthase F0 subunit 6 [Catamiarus brevipennis]WAJ48485.1 ATP synthase F0 subunit 6 [Catamiarus brevipennis]
MMTNLFSTFDPCSSISMSLNWISTFLGMLLIPSIYWIMPSRLNFTIFLIYNKLYMEFKMLLGPSSKGIKLIFIGMFMFILFNNMMGLLPYVFTSSSHMTFTLTMALPMWLSLMLFGWINNTQHMFSHLIPEGSPAALMPFMACIETISNIIRPGSLAVRLTANMIAGHLLMCLLGNNLNEMNIMLPLIMSIQIILMMFETAVSLIQAYVFSILSTLYTSEVIYENTK